MEYKIKNELNRLSQATDSNKKSISDIRIEIKRAWNEIQVIKDRLEALLSRLPDDLKQ